MTYLEKPKKSNTRRILISIVFVAVVLYTIVQLFAPHLFSAVSNTIAVPFWRTEFSVESGSLRSVESLLRENEYLKQELAKESAKITLSEYIDFENSELRSGMGKSSTTSNILAAVLKRPPVSLYDELIIDVGRDQNISTTSIVYATGNIPIGRVAEVFGQTSKVILFSSPKQKQEVLIGEKHYPATAIGRGGGQYEAELPRGLNVDVGDFVLASSIDARPIAKVISVNIDPTLPFEKILFLTPVNIYELRWVYLDHPSSRNNIPK